MVFIATTMSVTEMVADAEVVGCPVSLDTMMMRTSMRKIVVVTKTGLAETETDLAETETDAMEEIDETMRMMMKKLVLKR
jgi:hypothetical protein